MLIVFFYMVILLVLLNVGVRQEVKQGLEQLNCGGKERKSNNYVYLFLEWDWQKAQLNTFNSVVITKTQHGDDEQL